MAGDLQLYIQSIEESTTTSEVTSFLARIFPGDTELSAPMTDPSSRRTPVREGFATPVAPLNAQAPFSVDVSMEEDGVSSTSLRGGPLFSMRVVLASERCCWSRPPSAYGW